ncbi:MAG: (2Fe-2S) ferredoxin domain-containing protein [Bacillota bacterium]
MVVCVGSSCFLRGAPLVIQEFEKLISERAPGAVEIKGSFCMERCTHGVTVQIGDQVFTAVKPEDVPGLFQKYVLTQLQLG